MRRGSAVVALVAATLVGAAALFACDSFSAEPADDGGLAEAGNETSTDGGSDAGCTALGVDLARNADNCGSCGHSCFGGTCTDGVCGPVSVLTVPDAGDEGVWGLAIVDSLLFLSDSHGNDVESAVLRANLDGTNLTTIDRPFTRPLGIAADEGSVYYVTGEDARLEILGLDGGEKPNRPPDNGLAGGCLLIGPDQKSLYFTYLNEIRRLPFGAQTPVKVANGTLPFGIAVSTTHLFWTSPSDGTVWMADADGGAPTMLTDGEQGPACMALDGDLLYWANSLGGQIVEWSLSSPQPERVLAKGENTPISVVVTKDSIWWTTHTAVRRMAKPVPR